MLRQAAGRVGVKVHQHSVANRQIGELHIDRRAEIGLSRLNALEIAFDGTWTCRVSPCAVFTVSVSPLIDVMAPR